MVGRHLDLKLFRDLKWMRAQVLTIALVVACGVGTLVGMLSTYQSLETAQYSFYQISRFAHLFAGLKRAPISVANRIGTLEGVNLVEDRLTFDLLVDLPGRSDPAVGRFISLPDHGELELNRLFLKRGRMPLPNHHDETVVTEAFFVTNGLKLNQELTAVFNGRSRVIRVVGSVVSPEYIFTVQGGTPLPDDVHFGVFWIARSTLASAFDMQGAFNGVSVFLVPGASTPFLLHSIDEILKPYGGVGAIERKNQSSHMYLTEEIRGLKIQATFIPIIFLCVAGFLLHVVVGRMVSSQREQIATLKALGYADKEIAGHFLKLALVIVVVGDVLGVLMGRWIGTSMTELYTGFFRFPVLTYVLPKQVPIFALALSLGSALIGVWHSLREIFQMNPAEAMRPPTPPDFGHSFLHRWGWIQRFSDEMRMILRGLTVRPFRSLLTMIGMSLALVIIVLGLFWQDAVNYLMTIQFSFAQRESISIAFTSPVSKRALHEVESLPGVHFAEGYRTVPIRVSYLHRHTPSALFGLPSEPRLRGLMDRDAKRIPVPESGFLMSGTLAKKLGVKPGDTIRVEVLEGRKPTRTMRVEKIVDDFIGGGVYVNIRRLNEFMQESDLINSAGVFIDPRFQNQLYTKFKELPRVASVTFKDLAIRTFEDTSAKFILVFSFILLLFSVIIAFGIVYNSVRITLSERAWELATLRVLGFHHWEVFRILMGEMVVLLILSIPIGWVLGYKTAEGIMKLASNDAMDIPFIVERSTYGWSSLVLLFSGLLSGLAIWRQIRKLNLLGALKARG